MTQNPQFHLDQYNISDTLPEDFFFAWPYLVSIDLSGLTIFSLPLSISQCFLLDSIDISHTCISQPPPVLFSLPKLRTHPESIKYGQNETCSRELADLIINHTSVMNHYCVKFVEPAQNDVRQIALSPEITCIDLIRLIHPEIIPFINYLFIKRQIHDAELQILIDSTPFSLYQYPDAVFSLEMKLLPHVTSLPPIMRPLLEAYIVEQLQLNYQLPLKNIIFAQGADLINILIISNNYPFLSSRSFHFNVKTPAGLKDIVLRYTFDAVDVHMDHSTHYNVFPPTSLGLEISAQQEAIFAFGSKGLSLDYSSLPILMPLFHLISPQYSHRPPQTDQDFVLMTFTARQKRLLSGIKHRDTSNQPLKLKRIVYTPSES